MERSLISFQAEKIVALSRSTILRQVSFYYREYGYAPRSEIAGKKFGRTNPGAAKLGNRLLAPMYYNESTDSAVFEVWFAKTVHVASFSGPCCDYGQRVVPS